MNQTTKSITMNMFCPTGMHGKKERHTPFTKKKRGGSKDIKRLCLRACLMTHTHNVKFETHK
jgi:hypothetical protein